MEPIFDLNKKKSGEDFDLTAPWRMYYGDRIPGFPVHPHRGFETVTIVEKGYVDHTDSAGATGRYGEGDVQWMTAGRGMQHCEMFPMIHQDRENTLELFQIWLNLSGKNKMVEPYYQMHWHEDIPLVEEKDSEGRKTTVKIVAGSYKGIGALDPNRDSWAAEPKNHVAIWLIHLDPQAEFVIPSTVPEAGRMLYYFDGDTLLLEDTVIKKNTAAEAVAGEEIHLKNGNTRGKVLLLEGLPIEEPMAAYGPFVMNTAKEIEEAYADYRRDQFGGWPWDSPGPINPPDASRFARYDNGRIEYPTKSKT